MRWPELPLEMNKLVKFMETNFDPMGLSFKFALTEEIMDATGWSRKEIFKMAREARVAGELVTHYSSGGGKRWGFDEMLPEDLRTIGTIGLTWKPRYRNILFKQKTAF